ncbi:hypothetical protein ACQJBY_023997 [Aegilops geniculata]
MPTTTATPPCARLPTPRCAYYYYCSHHCTPSPPLLPPPPAASPSPTAARPRHHRRPALVAPCRPAPVCHCPPVAGRASGRLVKPVLSPTARGRRLLSALAVVAALGRRQPRSPRPAPLRPLSTLLSCSACCFRHGPLLQRASPAPCSSTPRPADRGCRLRPPWPSCPAPSSASGLARA